MEIDTAVQTELISSCKPISKVLWALRMGLLLFTQNPNAATDAAITQSAKCKQPRESGAMFLVLHTNFLLTKVHNHRQFLGPLCLV